MDIYDNNAWKLFLTKPYNSYGLNSQETNFLIHNNNNNNNKKARASDSQKKKEKKKRTCWIVDFAVPADDREEHKESEKRYKDQDLARELKKLWNSKVSVTPKVIDSLGTVTNGLVQGLMTWK